MKRNIIYMVGALLSSAILTFSCSEDDVPSYNEVSVDKTELLIKIENPNAEVNIIMVMVIIRFPLLMKI